MVTEREKTLFLYLYPKLSLSPKSSLLNSSLFLYLKPFNIFSFTFRESSNFLPRNVQESMCSQVCLSLHLPLLSFSLLLTKLQGHWFFFLTSISFHVLFPPPRKFSAHIKRCFYNSNFCLIFKWLMITLPKDSPKKLLSGKFKIFI